ncbi:hypothetical protein AB4Z10_00805 [Bosea sp. RAF48]|uniref:hypothetical protein n=1 Tax=Bosea sp. RAF48 TaxID=3237480 RepID=UPI003F8E1B52
MIQPTGAAGGNSELVEPGPSTLWALTEWYALHLAALDALDGCGRVERLRRTDLMRLAEMEPLVADGLLACELIRVPAPICIRFGG